MAHLPIASPIRAQRVRCHARLAILWFICHPQAPVSEIERTFWSRLQYSHGNKTRASVTQIGGTRFDAKSNTTSSNQVHHSTWAGAPSCWSTESKSPIAFVSTFPPENKIICDANAVFWTSFAVLKKGRANRALCTALTG